MVSGLTAKSNCGLALARSAHWQEPRSALATMCRGFLYPPASAKIDGMVSARPSVQWLDREASVSPQRRPGLLHYELPKIGESFRLPRYSPLTHFAGKGP